MCHVHAHILLSLPIIYCNALLLFYARVFYAGIHQDHTDVMSVMEMTSQSFIEAVAPGFETTNLELWLQREAQSALPTVL